MKPEEARLKAVEEYSIECAILKVFGSETLDYVTDESVQIHGGMGYSGDALAEKAYRDARINRIFEGTNEINRMLMVGQLVKKGFRGELDLVGPAQAVAKELTAVPSIPAFGERSFFIEERKVLLNLKKAFLLISGAAVKRYGAALKNEQEIMMVAADVMMEIYILESMILRTEKMVAAKGEEACSHEIAMTRCFLEETVVRCNASAREGICSFSEGDELNMLLLGLKRFTKSKPINLKVARRNIADRVLKASA
jgi:alkylation response protein AidB-like acyl-CoA dehydrogenase